jgi:hypothetical protein
VNGNMAANVYRVGTRAWVTLIHIVPRKQALQVHFRVPIGSSLCVLAAPGTLTWFKSSVAVFNSINM